MGSWVDKDGNHIEILLLVGPNRRFSDALFAHFRSPNFGEFQYKYRSLNKAI